MLIGRLFAQRAGVAVIPLVVYLVTFLFDPRIGLPFLVLAIVMFYRRGVGKRRKQIRTDRPAPSQKPWKDPWGAGPS
jgi:hypothetical protein